MVRRIRPTLECLEGKALLSGVSTGLDFALKATPSTTSSGTQVVLTLTETNVSNHDVNIEDGPSIDGFSASRNGEAVWVSNAGINPMFIQLVTLKPGQSYTVKATWDGRSNDVGSMGSSNEGPPVTGTFTIRNGLDPVAETTVTLGTTPSTHSTHITPPRPRHRIG